MRDALDELKRRRRRRAEEKVRDRRIPDHPQPARHAASKMDAHLKAKFPQAQFRTEATEKVGSLVGSELIRSSLIALGLGLLGIMIYVAVQFEFSFAICAIVALLHDLLITIGIYSLAGREISLIFVGAVLTIAGYSVNDKIVVFDRIREGIRERAERLDLRDHEPQHQRDALAGRCSPAAPRCWRSGALYFLGGPVLNDFAFAIFVGVVVGTYSSIYIAAPIVLWWSRLKGKSLHREVKESEVAATPVLQGRS